MAVGKRTAPTKGSRILVKLPFGSEKTAGGKPASQYVSIKQAVARVLGFEPVKTLPTKKVATKVNGKSIQVTRYIQGSYRRKSVKLIFKSPKTITGSTGRYKSVSMPIPSGVTLDDVVKYFMVGAGKSKGVIALISPDGKRIQWAEASLNGR